MGKTVRLPNDTFIVNDLYSTNERIIGKWINGKPIYRRAYDISHITSSNTDLVNISSLHRDEIIKMYGFIKSSTNYIYPIPLSDSSSNYSVIFYNGNSLRGRAALGSGGTISSAYVIIEYTKTTD